MFNYLKLWLPWFSSFSIRNGEIILRKIVSDFACGPTHAMQALTNAATAPNTAASLYKSSSPEP